MELSVSTVTGLKPLTGITMSSIFDVCRASVSLSPNALVSDGIFTLNDIKQSCGKCHYSLILFKVKRSPGTKELRKIKNLKCHCCDFNYIVYKQIYALQARFFYQFPALAIKKMLRFGNFYEHHAVQRTTVV